MPWAVHIDREQRVSYARLSGLVTFEDIVAIQAALAKNPDFDSSVPLLIDMLDAEDLRLTWPEIQQAIDHSPLLDHTRRAIVVDALNVLGTARVYEMAREHKKENVAMRIFRTIEEAADWLGVDALNL